MPFREKQKVRGDHTSHPHSSSPLVKYGLGSKRRKRSLAKSAGIILACTPVSLASPDPGSRQHLRQSMHISPREDTTALGTKAQEASSHSWVCRNGTDKPAIHTVPGVLIIANQ